MRGKQEGWLQLFLSILSGVWNCWELAGKGWANPIDPTSFHSHSVDTCSRLLTVLHMQIGTLVEETQKQHALPAPDKPVMSQRKPWLGA